MSEPFGHYMTPAEVADYIRCSEPHARHLMRSGRIEASRPGHRWLATRDAVDRYVSAALNTTQSLQRRRRRRSA